MKNKQAFMVLFVLVLFFCNRALGAEPVDSCRMCVLYKYNIATQDRSHKAVTDSVLSVLEIGDNVCKYGDLTRYAKKKGTFPEAMGKQPVDAYDSRINAHTFVYQQYPEEGTMTVREFLHPSFLSIKRKHPITGTWKRATRRCSATSARKPASRTEGGNGPRGTRPTFP